MKKAIVTGATGLVGLAVSKYLAKNGIEVLCLGRQRLKNDEITTKFGLGINYLSIPMEEVLALAEKVQTIGWSPGDECVFFNFAWGGINKLTDGGFKNQLNNAVFATNAVMAAKKVGCTKFVNAGTVEETYAERFLKSPKNTPYNSTQTDYALSKLAARDMCKMVAYLEKIDYVHTRLSVPLDPSLKRGGYISAVLAKIHQGKSYEKPSNKQLFDIIFVDEVARAYALIGFKGKNKADYFIGTAEPRTLQQYFELFESLKNDGVEDNSMNSTKEDMFNIDELTRDTGFQVSAFFKDIIKYLD